MQIQHQYVKMTIWGRLRMLFGKYVQTRYGNIHEQEYNNNYSGIDRLLNILYLTAKKSNSEIILRKHDQRRSYNYDKADALLLELTKHDKEQTYIYELYDTPIADNLIPDLIIAATEKYGDKCDLVLSDRIVFKIRT